MRTNIRIDRFSWLFSWLLQHQLESTYMIDMDNDTCSGHFRPIAFGQVAGQSDHFWRGVRNLVVACVFWMNCNFSFHFNSTFLFHISPAELSIAQCYTIVNRQYQRISGNFAPKPHQTLRKCRQSKRPSLEKFPVTAQCQKNPIKRPVLRFGGINIAGRPLPPPFTPVFWGLARQLERPCGRHCRWWRSG